MAKRQNERASRVFKWSSWKGFVQALFLVEVVTLVVGVKSSGWLSQHLYLDMTAVAVLTTGVWSAFVVLWGNGKK